MIPIAQMAGTIALASIAIAVVVTKREGDWWWLVLFALIASCEVATK